MQLDTMELGVLAEMLNAQKVAQLEKDLAEQRKETDYWRSRCEQLDLLQTASTIENLVLKNYIMLSAGRIKQFVARLGKLEQWAFLRAFMQTTLPEELTAQEMPLLDKVMPMPDEKSSINIENIEQAGDINVDGNIKAGDINVDGNFNDVHDNDKVTF